jgi:hypothetical protein
VEEGIDRVWRGVSGRKLVIEPWVEDWSVDPFVCKAPCCVIYESMGNSLLKMWSGIKCYQFQGCLSSGATDSLNMLLFEVRQCGKHRSFGCMEGYNTCFWTSVEWEAFCETPVIHISLPWFEYTSMITR